MAEQTMNESYKLLPDWIKIAIEKEIKIVTEDELSRAQQRIEERKGQIIAGVIIYVQKEMQVQALGENLIITIRNK